MPDIFTFHHVGVAVPDVQEASAFYAAAFGFRIVSGPFDDPIQKVRVCFIGNSPGSAPLELISPLDESSPVNGYLGKGIGAYHMCYEVSDIAATLKDLRNRGCLVVSKPVPAVAFGGRKIAWCFTPTQQLLELLERQP